MSDEVTDKLAPALVKFQKLVPVIPKNKIAKIKTKNGGEYSYNYADLADMWDAIREPLFNSGLAVTQGLVGGSNGFTGIQTVVWHESGQHFVNTVEVPTEGKNAQEVGSQITYFKRYALGATLGISTEEDDDGQAVSQPKALQQHVRKVIRQQVQDHPAVYTVDKQGNTFTNQEGQDSLLRAIQKRTLDPEAVAKVFQDRFHKHPRNAPNDELMSFALLLDQGAVTLGVGG